MKALGSIALAALFASGCATQPYGDPYGQGPYGDPYPAPPTEPSYPPPPYPPGNYPPPGYGTPGQPPVPAACPITGSRDWRAWINAMPGPGAQPKLMVTGTVLAQTGGYSFAFEPYLQVRESYPAQAFATLQATAPQGPATQAITAHDLRWEWPVSQEIGSVEIRCGSDTLATIAPVETAR